MKSKVQRLNLKGSRGNTVYPTAILRELSLRVEGEVSEYVDQWARTVRRNFTKKAGLHELNERIVQEAKMRMGLHFMENTHLDAPVYRAGDPDRFSGGRLLAAIMGSDIIRANPGGSSSNATIEFIPDVNKLDEEVAHWYRMNFGSTGAAKGKRTIPRGSVRIWGESIIQFTTAGLGPSDKANWLPPGYWVNGFEFYPAYRYSMEGKLHKSRMTKPIQPVGYIEVAMRYIHSEYGRGLERLFEKWLAG